MKFNVKRATATVLLAAMLMGSAPINVYAQQPELAPSKINTSVRAVDTPDWEVSDEEANSEYWPLAAHNRLIEPSTGDFIKNPTIEYGGSYNFTDLNSKDREVIKLLYKTNSSPGGAWNKMLLKFDKTLYQMIDWDNNQTGAWKNPSTNRGPASPLHFKNGIMSFTRESREKVGSENVVSFDIDKTGFKANVLEAPMHFVLKDQETLKKANLPTSIDELTKDREPVIQMRIVDKKYERVRMNPTKHRNGYSTYTPSTVIPKKDYRVGLIPQSQQDNGSPWIFAQDSYISYDKNKGYVDLTIRHNKANLTGTAFNPYIGLRTVMEDKFFNILAGSSYKKANGTEVAEDSNAKIADVFLINADENPYGRGATYDNPITERKIPVLRSQINDGKDGLKYIQVVGSDYNKTDYESNIKTQHNGKALDLLINGAIANSLKGVATVVRFYVQPDKFDKIVNDSDLLDMTFYTTFTMQTKTPKDTFTGKVDKDRKLKKDDEMILDVGTDEFSGGALIGDRKLTMEVGERPHTVVFNAESNAIGGTSLYWKDKTSYWWRIPYDMTLKEGTPIKIYMEGLKKPIKEVRFYKNKDEQAKGNNGDFFTIAKDAEKTGDMQYARFAGNLKSPHVAKTQNEASIPEIFTEDNIIYGHTKVGNAIVRATGIGVDDTLLKQAYLTDEEDTFKTAGSGDNEEVIIDQKKSQAVIVNKKIEFGYEFSTKDAINPKDPLGATTGITNKKYKMIKDAPIGFTTEDFSINAVEKLPPIIEQVQAKVKFDLNGGYLGNDPNAENAKKSITKIAPLNENYSYNVDKETNFPTTELNKDYKANAFEGEHRRMVDDGSGKQVMASHTDQPLGTETYKSMFDQYNKELEKRLTEAQALPTGAGAPNAIRNAAISEAQQDIDSFKNYVDKFYTSKGIDITKSQLWLREFPGKESQEGLKTENPKMDNKEFYGWTTKKVNTVDEYNKLEELQTADQAKGTEKAYKFTENSPILSEMTVYAFYGPSKSLEANPVQKYDEKTDKQYIEGILPEGKPLPESATVELVKKISDGNYTKVEVPVEVKDGKVTFDVKDENIKNGEAYYIAVTEKGKATTYSANSVKIDKAGPSFGEANKNMTIEQDAYGYQVKISATAEDASGILRVYAEDDKANGYYKAEATDIKASITDSTQNQGGQTKAFTVTAIDKFGNKTIAKKEVQPVAEDLDLRVVNPRNGKDFVIVTTTPGAEVTIEVVGQEVKITHTQENSSDKVKLKKDGNPFKLSRRQKVKVTAENGGQKVHVTTRVK